MVTGHVEMILTMTEGLDQAMPALRSKIND